MAFEGPIEDRLEIRELYGAYSDCAFRQDLEAWLACWAENGVWQVLGVEVKGKAALREHWARIWAPIERLAFFAEVGATVVTDDRATARCFCRESLFIKGGGMRELFAEYDDQLVRENGAWVFARRDYKLLVDTGADSTPLPAEMASPPQT